MELQIDVSFSCVCPVIDNKFCHKCKKKNVICLPTKHQGVHKNSFRSVRAYQDRIGIWKCWFLRIGENRSTRRKTSRSREENQQQTQPTYDTGSKVPVDPLGESQVDPQTTLL